jgi:hypothetical protein
MSEVLLIVAVFLVGTKSDIASGWTLFVCYCYLRSQVRRLIHTKTICCPTVKVDDASESSLHCSRGREF